MFYEQTAILPDDQDDLIPEITPRSQKGDLYQLGNHRLLCGDATDPDDVKTLTGGAKIDLVFTDPPYGINIVHKNGLIGSGLLAKNKIYSQVIGDNTTDAAEKAYAIYKTLTNKMIIWGGNYFPFLDHSDGWLIWDKKMGTCRNDFADGEMAYCSFHTQLRIYHHMWNGFIRADNETKIHPTQKPVRMLSEILKDYSGEGDTVLDTFGGSGSTLIACERTKRKCYMMELDPYYIDAIIQRYESITNKKAIKLKGAE